MSKAAALPSGYDSGGVEVDRNKRAPHCLALCLASAFRVFFRPSCDLEAKADSSGKVAVESAISTSTSIASKDIIGSLGRWNASKGPVACQSLRVAPHAFSTHLGRGGFCAALRDAERDPRAAAKSDRAKADPGKTVSRKG